MSKSLDKLLTINGYPLDKEQRKVVLSEDKYVMVIAGAGAGKSTTMIGKIKYLISIKKIKPSDIVAISFTNESVNSLKESLLENKVCDVLVTTFHKLALSFIDKSNIISDNYLEYIIKEYLLSNKYNDKKAIILKAFNINSYSFVEDNVGVYVKQLTKIINNCHTNNYQIKDFLLALKKINHKPFWQRLSLLSMLYIIMDIYYLYIEEKESIGSYDFDDMIINATKNISNYSLSYKYIIVDEYQDTSLIRVRLLQEIIKNCNCKLVVVGDDYQSIYRFNGCDLNIFLNFKKYFKKPKVFKLKNTYRNSQELIDISKKFILKNPYQIKKKLISNKHLLKPIKIIYYNDYNKERKLTSLVNDIKKQSDNYLILGRNNFDLKNITNKDYKYLTIHKSKGLEADNIIIINLIDSSYGLPNKVRSTPIEKVLFHKEDYPYDEERRLFYVALTRTKNYVYLFVDKNNKSVFIKEVEKLLK